MNGRLIPLEHQIASGGEGAVFTLSNDQNIVAKVYHRPPSAQTAEKISAMIRLATPELISLAAWPMGLLYHARTRQLAGFVMPRLNDCQPIQHLYNPVQRFKFYQRAGWSFQVRAALNLAAAFDEVHKTGCLIGDVNERNAQVSTQALVRLIDCDSFQVRLNGKVYFCEVGVPHYIPPELQGKQLRCMVRTENHDRFGLAVLIYQLLFVGRHPYAGVYHGAGDPSFEKLIAEFRFAQGPEAHKWGMDPPPHTPTFADIPPEMGTLFRRAFERGSEAGTRPRPDEWLSALKRLEQSIVVCEADPGHKFWRGAASCVWCRLADNGGPEYYFAVDGSVGAFSLDDAKLQAVLRRLSSCGPFDFPYDRSRFTPARLPEAEQLPFGLEEHRSTSIVLWVSIALCVLAIPAGLIHKAIFFTGFLGTLVLGIWLAIHISLSPWHREYRRRQRARSFALKDLNEVEEKWHGNVRSYHREQSELNRTIQRLISECRALGSQYQVELERMTANVEEMARVRHMRLHMIADADIPKIGAGRKQILASFNIFTAADIDQSTIRRIKGFGDVLTNSLLEWKCEVLGKFQFHAATALSPADQRSLAITFRNRQQQFLAKLDRDLGKLESLSPACRASLQNLVPSIQKAIVIYTQTEADIQLMRRRR